MLQSTFGFQEDSTRNQLEHMLSLLQSHCAMVSEDEQETDLLGSGSASLRRDVMEDGR